jgi:CheY-like chemotaxis protein
MQQQPEAMSAGTSSSRTILLVEDQPIFRAIIKRAIEGYTAHQVIAVGDGSHLLEVLHEHQPHLLMLDYELPGKNGIELYDLVHETSTWKHLPAIIVSADPPRQDLVHRQLQSLNKPCPTGELLRAIEQALTVS